MGSMSRNGVRQERAVLEEPDPALLADDEQARAVTRRRSDVRRVVGRDRRHRLQVEVAAARSSRGAAPAAEQRKSNQPGPERKKGSSPAPPHRPEAYAPYEIDKALLTTP